MALAIVSGMTVDELIHCISNGDSAALTHLPGVGKKTAERLIIEMRDRIKDIDSHITDDTSKHTTPSPHEQKGEAEKALVSLGYKPAQASLMISKVLKKENPPEQLEDIIRHALKGSLQ